MNPAALSRASKVAKVELAARNNAHLCHSVCQAHQTPGEFHDTLWLNQLAVPRFYPNAVTLAVDHQPIQKAMIWDLLDGGLSGSWAVKDSFNQLDLDNLGFQVLFEASWLWLEPDTALPAPCDEIEWAFINNPFDLSRWEQAWRNSLDQPHIFVPDILFNPDIAFIAAFDHGEIIAGTIANASHGVVGLSNMFVPETNPEFWWQNCMAIARHHFPDRPLVCYESGSDLDIAKTSGFSELQPLQVWLKEP
ncbi:hypothetical protein M3P05_05275 [Sansalvadorimonas sp. 2012CJ34-2]|uniref:Uncharacterized protein n=1 Tax=Parendozoicomonas callyspongiae TaxID=2942213 RepID=A0ABT0PDR2_9GAMM|nr:hypothetical protein [Sansalvadorimonas sp. 2012CJ34-2]MCL6269356.1 hypothetical protein [Sansalvadorimonas sp. 2012CJ34-2]